MRQLVSFAVLLLAALWSAAFARAASPTIVVGEIYAAGGNAGALYANDYVELFNRGSSAVDVAGWSLQYATAAGTTWSPTPLAGSIGAGRRLLVQLGSTGTAGAALPAADVTGTTNLAASGGKLALVRDPAAILCGGSPGSCAGTASIVDLVGYGSATDYEGAAAAPALDAVSADIRAGGGCVDTDANASDFDAAAPSPQSSTAAATPCSGTVTTGAGTASVAVDADVAPVLSLALERPTLSFGQVVAGTTPTSLADRVTVFSSRATGYELSVHRTAFAPADLPLAISTTAPAGAVANAAFAGGLLAAIPLVSAPDLLLGTSTRAAPVAGDVWPAVIGFTGPLPAVAPGRYTSNVTFTVIGR